MSNMRKYLKKMQTSEPRRCEHCQEEFKPNAAGLTMSIGEYLTRGLTWFCDDICSENYIREHGY